MRSTRSETMRWIGALMTSMLLVGYLSAVALAGEPHGAAGEGGVTPVPVNDVIEAFVNFALFAALLYWLGRGPARRFFETRSQAMAADLDRASHLRGQAEMKLDEYTTRLERLDRERHEILVRYRAQAEAEKDQIIQAARREAQRLRSDARAIVKYESERARREIQNRIVDRAVEMATRTIEEKMNKKTDRHLVDQFTEALSEFNHGQERRMS